MERHISGTTLNYVKKIVWPSDNYVIMAHIYNRSIWSWNSPNELTACVTPVEP